MISKNAKERICPFTAQFRLYCIAEKCMAWQPDVINREESQESGKCKLLIEEME